jgi:uncharacterized protein (DUF2147 family)
MKKFAFSTIATLAVFATTMFAADINGKWTAEVEGRNGQKRTTTFNLKAEGEKLTGTVSGPGGREFNIEEGKISGDNVSFAVTMEFNGNSRKVVYKGTASGDQLNLKRGEGDQAREVTAKRSTS